MLLLRSNRVFKDVVELDPSTGTFRQVAGEKNVATLKVNGFFEKLNGTFVALYASSGQLFLSVEKNVIKITEGVTATVTGGARNRLLKISDENGELASIAYAIDNSSRFVGDQTPFVENEDFDFGLFISNIVTSAVRRNVVLESWS